MYFEWTLWKVTSTGKEKIDSGTITDKRTLAGAKRTATNLAPDSLKKADWRHDFGNIYVKRSPYHQLYLRVIPTQKGELPSILQLESSILQLSQDGTRTAANHIVHQGLDTIIEHLGDIIPESEWKHLAWRITVGFGGEPFPEGINWHCEEID